MQVVMLAPVNQGAGFVKGAKASTVIQLNVPIPNLPPYYQNHEKEC
jgi:hypothetical protein